MNKLKTRVKRCFTKHKPDAGRRKSRKMPFLSLVALTFDLWLWPSNSSERGTKHVFRVNLAQIRSAVPQILHTQKHELTTPKTELSAVRGVR